jgi:hypothetical protein
MKTIDLHDYAPIISDNIAGDKILKEIQEVLKTNDIISIDMKDIKSMATFCAKQIFGQLYIELGSEQFFNRVEIINTTENVKTIIRIGIESVL